MKVLEGQLRAVMDQSHTELVRALDPLAEDGAVCSAFSAASVTS